MKEQSNKELDVTIVTINWNVTDKLQRCINSVLDSCEDIHYEMFVIDNDSHDADFSEVIHKYSKHKQLIFIKNDSNEGGLAMNKIQDRIKGRYLLILGPDTILKKDTVNELIKFMDYRVDVGAASGKLLNLDGTPDLYCTMFWSIPMVFYIHTIIGRIIDRSLFSYKKSRYYFGQDLDVNSLIEIDQPSGACMILRPELVLDDGYIIDSQFPFYYNDVDICKRIWQKGYKIYLVPTAEVFHAHKSSFKIADPAWKDKEHIKSLIKYFKKYHQNEVWLLKTIIFSNCVLRICGYILLILSPKRRYTLISLKEKIKTTFLLTIDVLKW